MSKHGDAPPEDHYYNLVLFDASFAGALELLVELSGSRMLREFVAVDEDLHAYRIADGEKVPIDAEDHIGELRIEKLKVVRWSCSGSPLAANQLRFMNDLREQSPPGQQTELGSIVVAPKGAEVSAVAFHAGFNINFLYDPWDLIGEPAHRATPIDEPDRLEAIAANACATTSGLWIFLPEAPLDNSRFRGPSSAHTLTDSVGNQVRLRSFRVLTRILDVGDVVGESMGYALADGVELPTPPGTLAHGNPDVVLDEVIHLIFPPHQQSPLGFNYQPLDEPTPPGVINLSPLQAIQQFIKEFLTELRRMPAEALQKRIADIKSRIEEVVQERTYGEDSTIRVRIRNVDSADQLEAGKRIQMVQAAADIEPKNATATPSAWRDLNQLVLSLADGSPQPEGFPLRSLTWNGSRGVLTEVEQLAARDMIDEDGGGFTLTVDDQRLIGWAASDEPITIRGNDVIGARNIEHRVNHLEASRPLPPPRIDATGQTVYVDPSSDATGDQSLGERFRAWKSARSDTLLWRISERLADQTDIALDDFASTEARFQQLLELTQRAAAAEDQSRKRFRRRAFAIVISLIGFIIFAVWGIAASFVFSAAVYLIAILLAIIAALIAMIGSAKARVRHRHRIRSLAGMPKYYDDRRRQAADEFARLTSLYGQFLDWAEIQATALHRPLGEPDTGPVDPWRSRVGALSFVSAEPVLDEPAMAALTVRIAQEVATVGWIVNAYRRQRDLIVGGEVDLAAQLGTGDQVPESDTDLAPKTVRVRGRSGFIEVLKPRRQLLHHLRHGDVTADFRTEYFTRLRSIAYDLSPLDMVRYVKTDVRGLNDPKRDVENFLVPLVTSEPVSFAEVSDSMRLSGTSKNRVVAGITPGLLREHALPPFELAAVTLPSDRLLFVAFRIDIGEPVPMSALPMVATPDTPDVDGTDDSAESQTIDGRGLV